jgi:hypothetical protein
MAPFFAILFRKKYTVAQVDLLQQPFRDLLQQPFRDLICKYVGVILDDDFELMRDNYAMAKLRFFRLLRILLYNRKSGFSN